MLDEGRQSYGLKKYVESSSEITDFCKKEDITVNTYLQTALLCALMRILRQDKLMMLCTTSGRGVQTQAVLGNVIHFVPVSNSSLSLKVLSVQLLLIS